MYSPIGVLLPLIFATTKHFTVILKYSINEVEVLSLFVAIFGNGLAQLNIGN
jgi:hypothetical protein